MKYNLQSYLEQKQFFYQNNKLKLLTRNHSLADSVTIGLLKMKGFNIEARDKDFYLDAFWAFQVYLRLFNKQDSHIIKNETERIMKMTQWAVRNSVLESLGI